MMRVFSVYLLLLASAAMPALSAQHLELTALMQRLANVRMIEATFREEKHMSVLSDALVATGTLTYKAPGYLKKQVDAPSPTAFEIVGDELLRDDGRRISLSDYPHALAMVEAFRATLRGDLAALNRHYDIEFSSEDSKWHMILAPKSERLASRVAHVVVKGRGEEVNAVTTLEPDGDRTVMTVDVVALE